MAGYVPSPLPPVVGEEANIRDLVQNSIEIDDFSSVIRVIFENHASGTEGKSIFQTVQNCLRAVAVEQEKIVRDVCYGNAMDIANCIGEMDKMRDTMADLKSIANETDDVLYSAGQSMIDDSRKLQQLQTMQSNLALAVDAIQASRQVLSMCLDVGAYIDQHHLYRALCLLETMRQEHLRPLFELLSRSNKGADSGTTKAQEGLQELSSGMKLQQFFEGIVTELSMTVESMAVADFNNWLVSARAQARQIGLSAIRRAASERQMEEEFARERKVLLNKLSGCKDLQQLAAELVGAQFRQDMLKESAGALATGKAEERRLTAEREKEKEAILPRRSRGTKEDPTQKTTEAIAQVLAPRRTLARVGTTDMTAMHTADSTAALLGTLDMRGLHRCAHIHACLGKAPAFRKRYIEQRQAQAATDLQPPASFLESYQSYLAQVVGFFVVEDSVLRLGEGLTTQAELQMMWDSALASLKSVLERALSSLGVTPIMLLVKDFVLLLCTALSQVGYNVSPIQEVLLGSQDKYHDLLTANLSKKIGKVLDTDVLIEYEVRTPIMQKEDVEVLGLPAALEGQQPQPLPYAAPYTSCVPALLQIARGFVTESTSYLRGMLEAWELEASILQHRDRLLSRDIANALMAKVTAVSSGDLLRECMRMVANIWSFIHAMPALDAWTLQQALPSSEKEAAGSDKISPRQLKQRKPLPGSNTDGVVSSAQASLRAVQDAAERALLRAIAQRVEAIMELGRGSSWAPLSPLPTHTSAYIDQLLQYLQEVTDSAKRILPLSSYQFLSRTMIKTVGISLMKLFGSDGLKAYNLYSIQRLSTDLAALQYFASRCAPVSLAEEFQEPVQLCELLMSDNVEQILSPEVRLSKYPALELHVVANALDKYREAPRAANHPKKKQLDLVAKQLREQMLQNTTALRHFGDSED